MFNTLHNVISELELTNQLLNLCSTESQILKKKKAKGNSETPKMKERKTSEKEGICDGNNLKNISKGYVNTKIHVYNLLTKQGEMDNYFSELSGSLAI